MKLILTAPVDKLGLDRVAGWFVPAGILIRALPPKVGTSISAPSVA